MGIPGQVLVALSGIHNSAPDRATKKSDAGFLLVAVSGFQNLTPHIDETTHSKKRPKQPAAHHLLQPFWVLKKPAT
ncbi:hypothetical protein ccrud_01590 [Corynebacterium crudilactis]|uniref:Uncharacterized protein n=1 Tax=Corynebacterium crudilactis TaxID=1652495 RepID=A0A172QQS3_9CORY|nr:hypothetical protein ccrud_01590 [Corynebacterium crudilactis]